MLKVCLRGWHQAWEGEEEEACDGLGGLTEGIREGTLGKVEIKKCMEREEGRRWMWGW